MDRLLIEDLKIWKDKSDRKPLILRGARQVGKTWLLKDFGEKCFKDICYVNFEQKDMLGKIFDGTLSPQRIIEQLSVFHGKKIQPQETLLIFDEVQKEGPNQIWCDLYDLVNFLQRNRSEVYKSNQETKDYSRKIDFIDSNVPD